MKKTLHQKQVVGRLEIPTLVAPRLEAVQLHPNSQSMSRLNAEVGPANCENLGSRPDVRMLNQSSSVGLGLQQEVAAAKKQDKKPRPPSADYQAKHKRFICSSQSKLDESAATNTVAAQLDPAAAGAQLASRTQLQQNFTIDSNEDQSGEEVEDCFEDEPYIDETEPQNQKEHVPSLDNFRVTDSSAIQDKQRLAQPTLNQVIREELADDDREDLSEDHIGRRPVPCQELSDSKQLPELAHFNLTDFQMVSDEEDIEVVKNAPVLILEVTEQEDLDYPEDTAPASDGEVRIANGEKKTRRRSKHDLVSDQFERIQCFESHERKLLQSLNYHNNKQKSFEPGRFIQPERQKNCNEDEKRQSKQTKSYEMQRLKIAEALAHETINRDLQDRAQMHEILEIYGDNSCWRGYEPSINELNAATYHSKRRTSVTQRILLQSRRATIAQTKRIGSASPTHSIQASTSRGQFNSLPQASGLSTLERCDGPTIHVSYQKQLRKEMIDPSLVATIIGSQKSTGPPENDSRNAPNDQSPLGKRVLSEQLERHNTEDWEKKKKIQEGWVKQEWKMFMTYAAQNPETLMNLVPTPKRLAINVKTQQPAERRLDKNLHHARNPSSSLNTNSQSGLNSRYHGERINSHVGWSQERGGVSQRPKSGSSIQTFKPASAGQPGPRLARPLTAKQPIKPIGSSFSNSSLNLYSSGRGAINKTTFPGNYAYEQNTSSKHSELVKIVPSSKKIQPDLSFERVGTSGGAPRNLDEPEIITNYASNKQMASQHDVGTVATAEESNSQVKDSASMFQHAKAYQMLRRMNGPDTQSAILHVEVPAALGPGKENCSLNSQQICTAAIQTKPPKRNISSAHPANGPRRATQQRSLSKDKIVCHRGTASGRKVGQTEASHGSPSKPAISFAGLIDDEATSSKSTHLQKVAYKHKAQSISINQITLEARQRLWREKLDVGCLQDQQNFAMSNFKVTNRKLRQKIREREQRQRQQELDTFSLSDEIMKKLGIKKKVKHVQGGSGNRDASEQLHLVDWAKTPLRRNLPHAQQFNKGEDPRCLTTEQIPYCINLLRYCNSEFSKGDRLRQMFNKAFATLEAIYEELGLKRLFEIRVSDIEDVSQNVCLRLLIRAQFMLKVRSRLVDILNSIDEREKCLRALNYQVIESRDIPHEEIQVKVQQVADFTKECLDKVNALQSDKPHLIGNMFIYEGMDYAIIAKLEIVQVCELLNRFGIVVSTKYGPATEKLQLDSESDQVCTETQLKIIESEREKLVRIQESGGSIFDRNLEPTQKSQSHEQLT